MSDRPQRHILVAVSGNTPQIVTETLYYLWVVEKIRIEAVFIVTTSKGKKVAWEKLGGQKGAIARFCRDYDVEPGCIAFTEEHIILLKDNRGTPLEDIRSTTDNHLLQGQLLGFIKRLTDDKEVALHCAMGGGRRTMSAHMLLAMTLYGREHDRLTHILVQEEFETNDDFFYPPKRNEPIAVRNASGRLQIMQTKDHKLKLADIPVVRLRSLVGEDHQIYTDIDLLIKHVQSKIDTLPSPKPPELIVDLTRGVIEFNQERIRLRPFHAALLAYYAEVKTLHTNSSTKVTARDDKSFFQAPKDFNATLFLKLYKCFVSELTSMNSEQKMSDGWLVGLTTNAKQKRDALEKRASRLQSERSKLNRILKPLSRSLLIDSDKDNETRYGILLGKEFIRIVRNTASDNPNQN